MYAPPFTALLLHLQVHQGQIMAEQNSPRPLYLVERLIAPLRTDISYAYDDLVFIDGGEVVLQFSPEHSEQLLLFTNQGLPPEVAPEVKQRWLSAAEQLKISLVASGTFTIEQIADSEEVRIQFYQDE